MENNIIFRNDLLSIIIILGIVQGIFLSLFFVRKSKHGQKSNKYFGIILFLFAIHNLDFWASYSYYVFRVPFLFDISVSFTMAMGPLLYQYVRRSVNNESDRHFYWHFVLFGFFFLYSMFFVFQPGDFKYNVFIVSRSIHLPLKEVALKHAFDPLGIRHWTDYIISLQLIIYLLLSYYVFIKYLKNHAVRFFKIGYPKIRWLRNMLFATTVIILIAVIIQIRFSGGKIEYLLAISFTGFIYYISFNLIRGSAFLDQTLFPEKYLRSTLTTEMKNDYKLRIERLMADEKLYLNNLFSINRLSRHSGIPPNQISQILNEMFHQTFFEFVRHYRINEAQKLLSVPANAEIKIEEIAHKVGYNSKSAFNKAFLSITGETPLSFKKKNMF